MVLYHGQSAAERGFSTKKLLVKNLHNKSIHCQIIVVDYMKSNGYKFHEVPIGQMLIKSVKVSHHYYVDGLAKKKKKSVNEERKKKLESLNKSILSLNQKKDWLESTIADFKKDFDKLAYKPQHKTKSLSVKQLISKSNALKRAAVEKHEDLDEPFKETKRIVEQEKDLQIFVSNQ